MSSCVEITAKLDFTKMPFKLAVGLVRAVGMMFSCVRVPDFRDPYVVWAKSQQYDGDKAFDQMSHDERASTPQCFPPDPEDDKQWWSRYHHNNVFEKTGKGCWIHNREPPDWSQDNSYAAVMRDARRVEYINRVANLGATPNPAELEKLKEEYENDPEFWPHECGIHDATALPYLYAHGGSFNLNVEFTWTSATETLPFHKRKVDTSVPPDYQVSIEVPVINESGQVTQTRGFTDYRDACEFIEEQKRENKYTYDPRFTEFRGIPLVTNRFPEIRERAPKSKQAKSKINTIPEQTDTSTTRKAKMFQSHFKTRMGVDSGKQNRNVQERLHHIDEAKRVLKLLGFVTEEEQIAVTERAVVNRIKRLLINWNHKVRYQERLGEAADDVISAEFDVKGIWQQYYNCQMALKTASEADLANGYIITPWNKRALVWLLTKSENGVWTAKLKRTWDELQRKAVAWRQNATTLGGAQSASGKFQVAKGGKKGAFSALEDDVDLTKVTASAAPKAKAAYYSKKGFKAAAKRGQEATPVCPVAAKAPPKKTRAQQRTANKAAKVAVSREAYMARTLCKFSANCGNPDCGFKHPEGAQTREERIANKKKFTEEREAQKTAAETLQISIPGLALAQDEQEDVAGPADEVVEERSTVSETVLEEMRATIKAQMEAQMEAQMKAKLDAMRVEITEQVTQDEQKKIKHQETFNTGGFSRSFEMDFSSSPAHKATKKKVETTLLDSPRLSLTKGVVEEMRFGLPPRVKSKKLDAHKSSNA